VTVATPTTGLRPLSDGVIVEPFDLGEYSKGGIAIPDSAKHRSNEGVVVSVGPGKVIAGVGRVPIDLKEGDRVLFLRWSGYAITYEGRKLISLHESDILAVADRDVDVEITAHIPKIG
jgi:chaperonin GroES